MGVAADVCQWKRMGVSVLLLVPSRTHLSVMFDIHPKSERLLSDI